MKIETSHSITNDIDTINKIETIIITRYFGLELTKEVLQQLCDDVILILDPKIYSELEVGFCMSRKSLWVDFNSNSSGETHPIYLEF